MVPEEPSGSTSGLGGVEEKRLQEETTQKKKEKLFRAHSTVTHTQSLVRQHRKSVARAKETGILHERSQLLLDTVGRVMEDRNVSHEEREAMAEVEEEMVAARVMKRYWQRFAWILLFFLLVFVSMNFGLVVVAIFLMRQFGFSKAYYLGLVQGLCL